MVNKRALFKRNGTWNGMEDLPAYPMAGRHECTRCPTGVPPPDTEERAGARGAESPTEDDPASGWVTQARHSGGGSSLPANSLESFDHGIYPATMDDTTSYGDTPFYPQTLSQATEAGSIATFRASSGISQRARRNSSSSPVVRRRASRVEGLEGCRSIDGGAHT